MDKLNVFQGYQHCEPGTENRLTWSLMNLIRMSPLVRAAFLGSRARTAEATDTRLTTLQERECIVQTQNRPISFRSRGLHQLRGQWRQVDIPRRTALAKASRKACAPGAASCSRFAI